MYFQEITYKTAYALGFLAADGWVNKNTLGFALKGSDRMAVERIRDIISEELGISSIHIKDYMSKLNGKEYPACRFTVTSTNLIKSLAYYGIVESKSYKDIDYLNVVPDKYKMAWIFGYLDGDGGISNYKNSIIGITFTGRREFLVRLSNYIGYRTSIRNINENTSVIEIYRHSDILALCKEYINFNKIVLVLERKLRIACDIVARYSKGEEADGEVNTASFFNTCDTCGKTFWSRYKLNKCMFCNRNSVDGIHISNNIKTCKICGRIFNTSSNQEICTKCRYTERQKYEHPERYICKICGAPIKGKGIHNICKKCSDKQQEKVNISTEELKELIKTKNYIEIGEEYGVSAAAIRKKAIKQGVYTRKIENHKIDGINELVLMSFLSVLNVKRTAEICNIPDWKVRDILKCLNKSYGEIIVTGEPIVDNLGNYYSSISEAARKLGNIMYKRHILENLNGLRATAYGRCYKQIKLEEYTTYLRDEDNTELGEIYRDLYNTMIREINN